MDNGEKLLERPKILRYEIVKSLQTKGQLELYKITAQSGILVKPLAMAG